METKTKILKIFRAWATALLLFISFQVGTGLLIDNKTQAESPAEAKVLGESVSIRGGETTEVPVLTKVTEPDVSGVSAQSFLVFNLTSGETLLQKNPNLQLNIASLTKLMTALVVYNNLDLNKSFIVSPKDTLNVAPTLGLLAGDEVKALDVFNAMLIGSSNDAALALADFTVRDTDEDFPSLMNSYARVLGMQDSHFSNPMGFDSIYNYSTAEDLKALISVTEKLSVFTDLGRRPSYRFSGAKKTYYTEATNKLIAGHPDIQAIKTGSTPAAGETMATKFNMGENDIIIIVLKSRDREGDTLKLKAAVQSSFK
jgi:D-alanyl-D-alanine carboxypeptidase (penicillin-binding protein 5/6)